MKFSYFTLSVYALLFKINACIINHELLSFNSNSIAVSIQRGVTVNKERINDNLDFVNKITGSIQYDTSSFSTFISHSISTEEQSKCVLGNSSLGMFINECQSINNQQETELIKKYALYMLLTHVLKNHNQYLLTLQQQQPNPMCLLSKNTDSTNKTSLDESKEYHITCNKNISAVILAIPTKKSSEPLESLDLSEKSLRKLTSKNKSNIRLPDSAGISAVILDSNSFLESSFTHFRRQLSTVLHQVRITSDLKNIKLTQLSCFFAAINEIDTSYELVEFILMNGSSRKFNILFPLLESVYDKHAEKGKPITIVYNTTSASQGAYKKLYTLRNAITLPRSSLEYIIELDVSLASAIRSPERVGYNSLFTYSHVVDVKEEEYQASEKLETILTSPTPEIDNQIIYAEERCKQFGVYPPSPENDVYWEIDRPHEEKKIIKRMKLDHLACIKNTIKREEHNYYEKSKRINLFNKNEEYQYEKQKELNSYKTQSYVRIIQLESPESSGDDVIWEEDTFN